MIILFSGIVLRASMNLLPIPPTTHEGKKIKKRFLQHNVIIDGSTMSNMASYKINCRIFFYIGRLSLKIQD